MIVLQQNSAADLSMLVLESLEKAEVDVADELLGEDSTLRGAVCSSLSTWASVTDLLQSPFTASSPTWCGGQGLVSALQD